MINIYILPFILFIIGAYIYYSHQANKQNNYYKNKRHIFLQETKTLSEDQSNNLTKGIPWQGMDSSLLITLFGEPRRKRVLDQSLTRMIWSYSDLFVYLDNEIVMEWKRKGDE